MSKTKLLKLAYLVELFYYRKYSKRLSGVDWIYFKFGPWFKGYDEIISEKPFSIKKSDEYNLVDIEIDDYSKPDLDISEKEMINKVIFEFGHMELNDILDFIYFETEPMIEVGQRGEKLNFSKVKPADYYKIKRLKVDESVKRALRKEFREKLKNAKPI
ncbi:MAG: type II toxin-antitoxin system antitoxin SocA domain-containing protein [Candidatus Odinarchaeia archaeon]